MEHINMHESLDYPEDTTKTDTNEREPVVHPINEILYLSLHAPFLLQVNRHLHGIDIQTKGSCPMSYTHILHILIQSVIIVENGQKC